MTTATETKPKSTLSMDFIDGKPVYRQPSRDRKRVRELRDLFVTYDALGELQNESRAVVDALDAWLVKVK